MNLTRGEMGAAMAAILAVSGAAVSGYLVADVVSHETPAVVDVVPPVEGTPLPRIIKESHITGWEGMSGGSTLDAKVVKTTGVMLAQASGPPKGDVAVFRPDPSGIQKKPRLLKPMPAPPDEWNVPPPEQISPWRPLQPPASQATPWPLGK